MSLIKLNLDSSVKSTSAAAALNNFFKGMDKKAFFDLIDDGTPSDLSGPNDILDLRFIGYSDETARFGIVTKDEDEDAGFNVMGVDVRIEVEFDDESNMSPTLAKAKQALAKLR